MDTPGTLVEVKSTATELDAELLCTYVNLASLPISAAFAETYESKAVVVARRLWRQLLNEFRVKEPVAAA